jgi:hemerythrin-like domain-containing protein
MTTPHPVLQLMDEHRIIESVLDAMERQLAGFGSQPFPAKFFERALDFFSTFADGCHHYKEEVALFPMLKVHGVPEEGGPIGCMLHDHQFGRSCLSAIRSNFEAARGGSIDAIDAVAKSAADYIHMLRQHIVKEDNVLFRVAQQVITGADAEALRQHFADPTEPRITLELRQRYHALAAELAA